MGIKLGQSDLEVGRISLGTVKFGRNTDVKYPTTFDIPGDDAIVKLLGEAQQLGVNLLDTAPAYGKSEERIGRLLTGERKDWILCTKTGETYLNGESTYDYSSESIISSVTSSLKHLRTDYLDIVLIHSNGNDLDIIQQSDAFPALLRLKEKGDIRYIGMSSKSVEGSVAAMAFSDVLMLTLNLEDQSFLEVIAQSEKKGIGILLKKVFASGHRSPEESLSFVLSQPGVHSAVVGTIDPIHLRQNVEAAQAITP